MPCNTGRYCRAEGAFGEATITLSTPNPPNWNKNLTLKVLGEEQMAFAGVERKA